MRTLIILSKNDISKLENDEYVALKGRDGSTIVLMSDKAYAEYQKINVYKGTISS